MLASRLRSAVTLARWLGPWAGARVPGGVSRRTRVIDASSGTMRIHAYQAGDPRGVYLVLPGLHFLGPDDPRLDRFCRALARAGFLVVAPVIPAYAALRIDPSAFVDARRAYEHALTLARAARLRRPALFSVSFGSALAFELLADPSLEERPDAALVFGGFAELGPTVRFAATGRAEHGGEVHRLPSDPLNLPVVALHLLAHRPLPGDPAALERALREMVVRTWGRMELKRPGARDAIAAEVARGLPEELAPSFFAACGLSEDSEAWLTEGLDASVARLSIFDPGERLGRIEARVSLVHGRDDDVIPYFESVKLERALSRAASRRLHLTGVYGHTGASTPPLAELAREGVVLSRMLLDLASLP